MEDGTVGDVENIGVGVSAAVEGFRVTGEGVVRGGFEEKTVGVDCLVDGETCVGVVSTEEVLGGS